MDSSALVSVSVRRRIRKAAKCYMRRQFRSNPLLLTIREHFLKWRQECETKGYTMDPERIRKLRDIEAETNDYYSRLDEEVAPPSTQSEEMIDGELLSPIVLGPVTSKRAHDIVSLLWEFAAYGEAGDKPKITRNSTIYKALDIDPDELVEMTDEDALLLFLNRFESLMGLRGQPPEENNLLNLTRWVIRRHLPSEEEPETTPEAVSKAVEAGLIHKPIKVTDKESGEVAQVDVEDKSVVQPEDICDLDDSERLLRFAELVGIDINEFTPKERERMMGLVDLFEKDYEKGSKIGLSFKDYYGDKSDSEKTQRAKLFQKIRKRTSHPYLKD